MLPEIMFGVPAPSCTSEESSRVLAARTGPSASTAASGMVGSPTASSPSLSAGIVSTGGSICSSGGSFASTFSTLKSSTWRTIWGMMISGSPGPTAELGRGAGELGWGPEAACAMHGIAERASTKKTGASGAFTARLPQGDAPSPSTANRGSPLPVS